MSYPSQSSVRNRLLSTMSGQDFILLQPHLTFVPLERDTHLARIGQRVDEIVFIESGIGSTVSITPEGQRGETGLFGREGLSMPSLAMEVDTTIQHTFMQAPGSGYRLSADQFKNAISLSPSLRRLMLVYAYTASIQTAYTALSNAVHGIVERLARWLLMCHDRTDGDELAITHEFLAVMLAVRRPGVTTAVHAIEGARLIRARRGLITITDRAGLEEFASDAYGAPEAEYVRLIGPLV